MPRAIITVRGSNTIFKLMDTECLATTAYDSHADGQSERANLTVEVALRHLVNDKATDWIDHLPAIQLEINNAKTASTQLSPNEALMGFTPRKVVEIPTQHIEDGRPPVEAMAMRDELLKQRRTPVLWLCNTTRNTTRWIFSSEIWCTLTSRRRTKKAIIQQQERESWDRSARDHSQCWRKSETMQYG